MGDQFMPKRSSVPRRAWSAWIVVALTAAIVGLAVFANPGGQTGHADGHSMTLPDHFPAEPAWYSSAPNAVKTAYVEAAHHRDALQYIPCYCGCGEIHASNSACYFRQDSQGQVTAFDQHAYACQVCVDISQAVIAGLDEGKSLYQMRQEIDRKYEIYGLRPTPTPMPPAERGGT
jgi:hypothetical protein